MCHGLVHGVLKCSRRTIKADIHNTAGIHIHQMFIFRPKCVLRIVALFHLLRLFVYSVTNDTNVTPVMLFSFKLVKLLAVIFGVDSMGSCFGVGSFFFFCGSAAFTLQQISRGKQPQIQKKKCLKSVNMALLKSCVWYTYVVRMIKKAALFNWFSELLQRTDKRFPSWTLKAHENSMSRLSQATVWIWRSEVTVIGSNCALTFSVEDELSGMLCPF